MYKEPLSNPDSEINDPAFAEASSDMGLSPQEAGALNIATILSEKTNAPNVVREIITKQVSPPNDPQETRYSPLEKLGIKIDSSLPVFHINQN